MHRAFTAISRSLQPGLSCILLQAAYKNPGMQAVTIDHPDYDAAWRRAGLNFFTSAGYSDLLQQQIIKVILQV